MNRLSTGMTGSTSDRSTGCSSVETTLCVMDVFRKGSSNSSLRALFTVTNSSEEGPLCDRDDLRCGTAILRGRRAYVTASPIKDDVQELSPGIFATEIAVDGHAEPVRAITGGIGRIAYNLDLTARGIPFWMAARLDGGIYCCIEGSVSLP